MSRSPPRAPQGARRAAAVARHRCRQPASPPPQGHAAAGKAERRGETRRLGRGSGGDTKRLRDWKGARDCKRARDWHGARPLPAAPPKTIEPATAARLLAALRPVASPIAGGGPVADGEMERSSMRASHAPATLEKNDGPRPDPDWVQDWVQDWGHDRDYDRDQDPNATSCSSFVLHQVAVPFKRNRTKHDQRPRRRMYEITI